MSIHYTCVSCSATSTVNSNNNNNMSADLSIQHKHSVCREFHYVTERCIYLCGINKNTRTRIISLPSNTPHPHPNPAKKKEQTDHSHDKTPQCPVITRFKIYNTQYYNNDLTSKRQMKHQLDATLCRFYFCRVTLHVSGASAHHQEF